MWGVALEQGFLSKSPLTHAEILPRLKKHNLGCFSSICECLVIYSKSSAV